jgi:sugar phosphate isomerase/epimerase
MKPRYAVILGNLGNTCDRFLPTGYKEKLPSEEMIRQAAAIPGIEGLELVGSWDITRKNLRATQRLLDSLGLACVSIIPDLFSQKRWGRGSFAAKDATIRAQALEESRIVAELARELGCGLVNLWLGQDGYDYPLQSHYDRERGWLAAGLHTLAAEFPDLRFALEYKLKEPRTHSFQARAGDTLLMAHEIALPNVGVCIDTGHALMAGENLAEAAVLLHRHGRKLFHLHFNDNYRTWDDDMIVGSLHVVEFIELLFWLRELGYDGWYSMDQYPYREDGAAAVRESVRFLQGVAALLTPPVVGKLRALVAAGDATRSSAFVRELILPGKPKRRRRR